MVTESLLARIRARRSTLPPGANGTIMRIGRWGYCDDEVGWALHSSGATNKNAKKSAPEENASRVLPESLESWRTMRISSVVQSKDIWIPVLNGMTTGWNTHLSFLPRRILLTT